VAGDVEKRMVPESIVREFDACFGCLDLQARSLVDGLEKVWKAGWVRIPVAAAVVL
jgi:hypothetical protein